MSTIWKQELVHSVNTVQIPQGAEFLCAREQSSPSGDAICVWFKCEPERNLTERKLIVLPTGGGGPPENSRYIGTASLSRGALIFHVFEVL